MAETLGMLCDKLTVVKLKEYHTTDAKRLESLATQALQLQEEIDEYVSLAMAGGIPTEKLSFASNKVYKQRDIRFRNLPNTVGSVFYELAAVNCELWHEQEKVYDFAAVPVAEKDKVVEKLAVLNLERNNCIDKINALLVDMVRNK
jgi:hypothetical protein